MKKNRMMRLASILLVCVLLTTSVISGTFAKYTTQDSASDMARVAKWGIDVLVSGNLFGTNYNSNTADSDQNRIVAESTNVSSSGAIKVNGTVDISDIVAPGTMNDTGLTIKLSGKPEVAYKVTARTGENVKNSAGEAKPKNEDIFLAAGEWGVMVEAKGLNIASNVAGLYTSADKKTFAPATGTYDAEKTYYELHDQATVEAGGYYPINWTVAETGNAGKVGTTKNLVAIATEMVAGIEKTATVNANTDIAASYVLTWAWPFEDDTKNTAAGYTVAANDAKDTILGNLMADLTPSEGVVVKLSGSNYVVPTVDTDYNLDVVFNFDVIVEQAD